MSFEIVVIVSNICIQNEITELLGRSDIHRVCNLKIFLRNLQAPCLEAGGINSICINERKACEYLRRNKYL